MKAERSQKISVSGCRSRVNQIVCHVNILSLASVETEDMG